MSDSQKKERLKHHRSPHFTSQFASGVIVSGPNSAGLINFIFYEDTVAIESETLNPATAEGEFTVSLEKGDVVPFREDRARISMQMHTAAALYKILQERFEAVFEQAASEQAEAESGVDNS